MIPERIGMMFRRIMRLKIDVGLPTVEVKMESLEEEIHTDVEVIETYGMTVWPPDECPEGLAIFLNGEPDNGIVTNWRDPIFRPTFLLEGEVAFYSKWQQLIYFTQAGEVIISDAAGSMVTLDGRGDIILAPAGGKTHIKSDLVVDGSVDVNGASVKHDGVNIGKTHKHLHTTEFPVVPTQGPQ